MPVPRIKHSLTWIAALAALAIAGGCTKQAPATPQAPPAPKAPEVFVSLPTTGEVTDFEDFTGRTVATKTIDIRPRVTGYIDKMNFKELEGRDVQEGTVLFEIDPRPYQAEVVTKRAAVAQAEAHLARVQLDFDRAEKLIGSKSISREAYDLIRGERNEAQGSIDMAEAELDLAKLNLNYTRVRAPISGRVSRTLLDAGNLVRADETILTTIVAIDPIYAYFEVDERTLLRIRRYMEEGRIKADSEDAARVLMGLADEEGFPHEGTINFVDNRLDTGTGTLQVRGVFRNPDHELTPGLFVRIRLPVGEPYRAILISEEALGTDQGQKFVYVVDDQDRAQYRRVQVGKLQDGRRVVLSGLAEGEKVVVSGLQRVRPGAEVQAKFATAASSPADPNAPGVAGAAGVGKDRSQK